MQIKSIFSLYKNHNARFFGTIPSEFTPLPLHSMVLKKKQKEGSQISNPNHLIFLHGLLGQGKNFQTLARDKRILSNWICHLLDLRNHGNSPHHPNMTYEAHATDVNHYITSHSIKNPVILGHSMGGKTAIKTAILFPNAIKGVIVLDAPPVDNIRSAGYQSNFMDVVKKLNNVIECGNTAHMRKNIAMCVYESLKDRAVANLILQNLQIQVDYSVLWKCNMKNIMDNAQNVFGWNDTQQQYLGDKVLIIVGERSYKPDIDVYQEVFPNLKKDNFHIIKGAGHWVHADRPAETLQIIQDFLSQFNSE